MDSETGQVPTVFKNPNLQPPAPHGYIIFRPVPIKIQLKLKILGAG
jgi:hypothetical protein